MGSRESDDFLLHTLLKFTIIIDVSYLITDVLFQTDIIFIFDHCNTFFSKKK